MMDDEHEIAAAPTTGSGSIRNMVDVAPGARLPRRLSRTDSPPLRLLAFVPA
jgi:hypothetical protein